MNKIIAVLALLGSTVAINLKDSDDLYSDDDTAETLQSIQTAEKAHNVKFQGLSKDEEKVLIESKNLIKFDDDENLQIDAPKKVSFLGLQTFAYPEARPIGEVLMQLGFEDSLLANTGDDAFDEMTTTMESLAETEKSMGKQMKAPVVNEKFYEIQGNKYENFLADNDRISLDEIEEAQKDKEEIAMQARMEQQKHISVVQKKVEQQQTNKKSKQQRAFEAIAIHFNDNADAINDEEW